MTRIKGWVGGALIWAALLTNRLKRRRNNRTPTQKGGP